jgi:hypothetical protein
MQRRQYFYHQLHDHHQLMQGGEMNDDLKKMAALTALNDMMQKGYVSICTIDVVSAMLGINPKCEDYEILHALHCVRFDKMPKKLLDRIPELIQRILGIEPTFQFIMNQDTVEPLMHISDGGKHE